MSAKSSTSKYAKDLADKAIRDSWKTDYVQFDISEQERGMLKGIDFGVDELNEAIIELAANGYGVSWAKEKDKSTWMAFINPKGDTHKDKGWVLCGRGSTPVKALKQAAYVHFTKLDGVWPKTKRQFNEEIDD